jgi:hypothetical protein
MTVISSALTGCGPAAPAAGVPVDSINRYAAEVRALEAKVLAEQQAVLQARRPPRALRVSVPATMQRHLERHLATPEMSANTVS